MLLAIDTSTATIGLACYNQGELLAESSWYAGRNHTAQLMPQLTLLLQHLGYQRKSISAVAVARGPGSWSGLRVGLSAAKGMALALDLPVIGVGTLDTLLHQHGSPGIPVVPLIRLGRDRFATIDPHGAEPRNLTLELLCTEIGSRTLFCGDIDADVRETLARLLGERARFPSPAALLRRPGYLAELAWRRLQAGDTDDITTLEPIYLGQPVKQA